MDLGAEGLIAAERGGRLIAVEIKSFSVSSQMAALEQALGQYRLYRFLLARKGTHRSLYLAVDTDIYVSFLRESDLRELLVAEDVRLIVFNPEEECIVEWVEIE